MTSANGRAICLLCHLGRLRICKWAVLEGFRDHGLKAYATTFDDLKGVFSNV